MYRLDLKCISEINEKRKLFIECENKYLELKILNCDLKILTSLAFTNLPSF